MTHARVCVLYCFDPMKYIYSLALHIRLKLRCLARDLVRNHIEKMNRSSNSRRRNISQYKKFEVKKGQIDWTRFQWVFFHHRVQPNENKFDLCNRFWSVVAFGKQAAALLLKKSVKRKNCFDELNWTKNEEIWLRWTSKVRNPNKMQNTWNEINEIVLYCWALIK